MGSAMKVAVMTGIGEIELRERSIPVPGPGEVLVRIKSVSICGSDVHYFVEGRIGDFIVNPPFILGHECSGEVIEVGKGVKKIRPGCKVALEPGVPCGVCSFCRSGRYNLCPSISFWATPPVDGVFCEYVAHPEFLVYPLDEDVSFEEGALIEPLAVGLYATQRASAGPGEVALILGSGPVGLLALQALRIRGVTQIIVADVISLRLQKARELGATAVIDAQRESVKERVLDLTGGEGVDLVFETAGSVETTQTAIEVAKNGGKIVLVGFPPPTTLDINKIIIRELDILGSWRYANVYGKATALLNAREVYLQPIITHCYNGLDRVKDALFFAHEHKEEAIKVVLNI